MTIDDIALARAIHVLAIVHWIGGVAVVTTIVLPRAKRIANPSAAIAAFDAFERPFAFQARISILLAGLSGAYMLTRMQAWRLLFSGSFWWLHLMIAVWLLFAIMIYILEPLAIHRLFHEAVLRDKDAAFRAAILLHAAALAVAAAAIVAGVLGSAGSLA
jgi:uncharacterized membrane protein